MLEAHHVLDAGAFEHQLTWGRHTIHELTDKFENAAKQFQHTLGDILRDYQERTEERRWMPAPRPLREVLPELLALFELLDAANAHDDARLWETPFRIALRHHALAALLAAERERAPADLRAALQRLVVTLVHHGWQILGPTDAEQALQTARAALGDAAGQYTTSASG